jgi:hypothetical protein
VEKSSGIKFQYLKTHLMIFLYLVNDEHWNQIAKFRKFFQQIHNDRLIFIDETAIYTIMSPRRTLAAPRYQPLIIVEKPSAYAQS